MSYRKLTGRSRSLLGYSQLWQGEDHLLLVRSARLAENYQRFAFRDIQAIVIGDGPDLRVLQALAVIVSLGWTALAIAASSPLGRGFFVLTGLCGLALAIVDFWRGPRCRCVLHTAVSRESLAPVSRRKASGKFLAQVLPAIEAAQGAGPPEQLQSARAPAPSEIAAVQAQPPLVKRARSFVPEILFGLLLADAALVWIALRTSVPNAAGLLPTVYLAEILLAAVMMGQRRTMQFGLAVWGGLTLVFIVADVSMVSGIAAWATLMNATGVNEFHRELSSLWLSPGATAIFATSWRLAAGAAGLALCYFDRSRSRHRNA